MVDPVVVELLPPHFASRFAPRFALRHITPTATKTVKKNTLVDACGSVSAPFTLFRDLMASGTRYRGYSHPHPDPNTQALPDVKFV